jgi:hypothetical protein
MKQSDFWRTRVRSAVRLCLLGHGRDLYRFWLSPLLWPAVRADLVAKGSEFVCLELAPRFGPTVGQFLVVSADAPDERFVSPSDVRRPECRRANRYLSRKIARLTAPESLALSDGWKPALA